MEITHAAGSNKKVSQFNIIVDGVPYLVEISPFQFNIETRFNVTVNKGDPNVFAWDREMKMFTGLDDESAVLPDGLMLEINKKLLQMSK